MDIKRKQEVLVELGKEIKEVLQDEKAYNFPGYDNIYAANPWFIPEFVRFSLNTWSELLNERNLKKWLSNYNIFTGNHNQTLGLVLAGNIPLVGMHDFICGFICNYNIKVKLSSKDNVLMKWIIKRLKEIANYSDNEIMICESLLGNFNKIIATGSNNSNRYFEYYFSKTPNILRKNRTSIAILTGDETENDLLNLADDIFLYFGLGCRNVSKIYIPKDYNFEKFHKAIEKYSFLKNYFKYANNLDYQFAILSMNKTAFINLGFLFLIENNNFNAPVSILNFEYYTKIDEVINKVEKNIAGIQCIISKIDNIANKLNFGQSQKPELNEYADNIDTINFLNE